MLQLLPPFRLPRTLTPVPDLTTHLVEVVVIASRVVVKLRGVRKQYEEGEQTAG